MSEEQPRPKKGLGQTIGFRSARHVARFAETAGIVSREDWFNRRKRQRRKSWNNLAKESRHATILDSIAHQARTHGEPLERALAQGDNPRRQFFA